MVMKWRASAEAAPSVHRIDAIAYDVRVQEVMSWPALVVTPMVSVGFTAQVIAEQGIHHLPVVQHGDLLGIVCACDLEHAPQGSPVGRYMTRRVRTIEASAALVVAAQQMDDHAINALPSWWRGAWGILTRGDLVREGVCSRRHCAACGTSHHVRRHRLHQDQWFCLECLEQPGDTVDQLYSDLGVGG